MEEIERIMRITTNKLDKKIRTKLNNINKARVDGPCSTKRTSKDSVTSFPYDIIRKNNLILQQLVTFKNGIAIMLPFKEYKRIRDNEENNELDDYLLQNIGGNETVSCVITLINEDGYSGSSELRKQYDEMLIEIEKNNWNPIKRSNTNRTHKGNDTWEGHYCVKISGGQQETFNTPNNEDQIFTPHKSFICSKKQLIL
jgi:hypothetical protein